MGSSRRSTESGVTRRIPDDLVEAAGGTVLSSRILGRDGGCPAVVRFEVLLAQAMPPVHDANPWLRPAKKTGVVLVLTGAAVRITGQVAEALRKCIEEGTRYRGEIEGQEVRGSSVQVTVVFTAE